MGGSAYSALFHCQKPPVFDSAGRSHIPRTETEEYQSTDNSPLEVFRAWIDGALSNLLQWGVSLSMARGGTG